MNYLVNFFSSDGEPEYVRLSNYLDFLDILYDVTHDDYCEIQLDIFESISLVVLNVAI